MPAEYPTTPDGRYFVVRGRLWRCSNPQLAPEERDKLVRELMTARRTRDRTEVERTKRALGERGEPWWTDGTPDWNRHLAHNTPYAGWFESLQIPPGTAG
ncbi:hypothetical protein OMW55_13170 [Sphingomonas sp. BN140010]|uniref:Uncharacterized protein n=1 Tax=Sphingomonas arvum TaxID=2992113 RepID=A0ABT3JJ28_9SPHN|nr:hypothetical protein [Sphingomonas sp. BN140010]MCW3798760.1 hypothetical protein [Sphingomonas sp. BN140010]